MASHRQYAHDRRDDRYPPPHAVAPPPPPPADAYAQPRHDAYYQRPPEEGWERPAHYDQEWPPRALDPYQLRPEERGWMPPPYSRTHYDSPHDRWLPPPAAAHDPRYPAHPAPYEEERRHDARPHWDVDPRWATQSRHDDPVNNWQPPREEHWPGRAEPRDRRVRDEGHRDWDHHQAWQDRRPSYPEHEHPVQPKYDSYQPRDGYYDSRTYGDYRDSAAEYSRQFVVFSFLYESLFAPSHTVPLFF